MGERDQASESEGGGEGVGGCMVRYVMLGYLYMPMLVGFSSDWCCAGDRWGGIMGDRS